MVQKCSAIKMSRIILVYFAEKRVLASYTFIIEIDIQNAQIITQKKGSCGYKNTYVNAAHL